MELFFQMVTKEELKSYFETVDEDKRQFAFDTIEEYIFFRSQIEELSLLPLIQVSKKNPEMQRMTPAAKLIKEYSQAVDAKRSTLLRILYRVENNAADELLSKLAEFE